MFQSIAPALEFVILSLVPAAAVTAYWILARTPAEPATFESRQARLFGWFLWVGLVLISAVGMSVTAGPTGTEGNAASAGHGWKTAAALLPLIGLSVAEGVTWLRRGAAYGTRNERRTVPPRVD
ncbi:MAG TPA: hypothetical protein VF720_06085 [Candidatus Eisenbacteria bacterium]